jgi:hypothetical protein
MAIRIPSRVLALALYTLVLLGAAFGISYVVFEWRDEDEPTTGQPEAINAESEVEKSFSMTLETADDFEEAARRIGAFMPDFDCTGEWEEESKKGTLGCDAGLTGFECRFRWPKGQGNSVTCSEGEQPPPGFAACTRERVAANRYRVECSGASTATFCEVRGFEVTCQRP